MSQTFFVVLDGMGESYAAFEDLLAAIRDMEERFSDRQRSAKYFKVEAIWAENPEDAAAKGEDGYLKVLDTDTPEPVWFPELEPNKKTYFVVSADTYFLDSFPELIDAMDLWHYYLVEGEKFLPGELTVDAVYSHHLPDDSREKYMTVWANDRSHPEAAYSEEFRPSSRISTKLQRGGFPGPKDWTPTGKMSKLPKK